MKNFFSTLRNNFEADKKLKLENDRLLKKLEKYRVNTKTLIFQNEELRKKIHGLNEIIQSQSLDLGKIAYELYREKDKAERDLKLCQSNIKWLGDNLKARNSQVVKKDFQIRGLIKAIKKERSKNVK